MADRDRLHILVPRPGGGRGVHVPHLGYGGARVLQRRYVRPCQPTDLHEASRRNVGAVRRAAAAAESASCQQAMACYVTFDSLPGFELELSALDPARRHTRAARRPGPIEAPVRCERATVFRSRRRARLLPEAPGGVRVREHQEGEPKQRQHGGADRRGSARDYRGAVDRRPRISSPNPTSCSGGRSGFEQVTDERRSASRLRRARRNRSR